MIGWLTHLQHTRVKNVWFVGILDEKLDDFNRKVFTPQIDGSKTGLELRSRTLMGSLQVLVTCLPHHFYVGI